MVNIFKLKTRSRAILPENGHGFRFRASAMWSSYAETSMRAHSSRFAMRLLWGQSA